MFDNDYVTVTSIILIITSLFSKFQSMCMTTTETNYRKVKDRIKHFQKYTQSAFSFLCVRAVCFSVQMNGQVE
jgi:hypothetical protein